MRLDRRSQRVIAALSAALAFTVLPRIAHAQSDAELAAFSAIMLSPVGGLPPLARDDRGALPPYFDMTVRYGGWRYDIDDGVHNNAGLTLTKRLGASHSTIGLTASYVSLSCACSVWMSGGAQMRSTFWSAGGSESGLSAHSAVDASVGGARYMSGAKASALSTSARLDIGAAMPFLHGSRIAVSLLPGYGWGRLSSVDVSSSGLRPMVGTAVAWVIGRGFTIDFGTQRVLLAGGPAQMGGGISWVRQ